MQTDNKLLDDLARLATGAIGAAVGVRDELESHVRQRLERWMRDMDVPSREELEVARAMAAEARRRQEELEDRVASLEAVVATLLADRELAHADPAPKRPAPRKGHGDAPAAGGGDTD
ncbi:MAG TPA: accessory factor UbiK family protein [Azospirillaceae bacterium]|nr:accessory factor UbiK family protein [Azospirillaceae bacterium]